MASGIPVQITGDVLIIGRLIASFLTLPASSVTDASVIAGAGLSASKLQHQYQKQYCQESATDCVSEARVVHKVKGATATIQSFNAWAVVVAGSATHVDVDLKKNGTTVLASVIVLDNSQVAYQVVAGSLSSVNLVAGDILEIVFTLSGSSKPKGVGAQVDLREDAQ